MTWRAVSAGMAGDSMLIGVLEGVLGRRAGVGRPSGTGWLIRPPPGLGRHRRRTGSGGSGRRLGDAELFDVEEVVSGRELLRGAADLPEDRVVAWPAHRGQPTGGQLGRGREVSLVD